MNRKGYLLSFAILFVAAITARAQVRILFDATKGETAGNADWVIDADQHNLGYHSGQAILNSGSESNAQRMPTPYQGGVNGSTYETYWDGALSAWGIDCAKRGYAVETLPYDGAITYGDNNNPQDLSNYTIYVVDEPNFPFAQTEKTAIVHFVQNGGSLFMICDHDNSDRDGDGWDSPAVWNDLLNNNPVQNNPFGISFDLNNISQTCNNVIAAANDSIIHGPMGNVLAVKWSNGTTMTLYPLQNPTVTGVIFENNTAASNTKVMVAYAHYGKGKVAAIGDSSPPDDGTGDPHDNSLYTSYSNEVAGNHRILLMNIIIWMANGQDHTGVANISCQWPDMKVYPNPSAGIVNLKPAQPLTDATIFVTDIWGKTIAHYALKQWNPTYALQLHLQPGIYFAHVMDTRQERVYKLSIY